MSLSHLTLLLLLAAAPADGESGPAAPVAAPAVDSAPTPPTAVPGAASPPAKPLPAEPLLAVETNDHQTSAGRLVRLDATGLALETATGLQELPLKSLLRIAPAVKPARSAEKVSATIELVDQSVLSAVDFQSKAGVGEARLVGGALAKLPTRAIRSIRFVAPGARDEETDKQWNEILAAKAGGDLLVVRKKGALDFLEGLLQDLGSDSLTFLLDKEPVVVKRPKIEGLVYYHGGGAPLPEPVAELVGSGGTRLLVRSATFVDGRYRVATPAGVELDLPADQLAELDFSAGKVRYLSDLDPDSDRTTHYFSVQEPIESWEEFFRLRRDIGPEHGPLRLAGRKYAKGIAAPSRTLLAYRLPGDFRRFEALVGIDDQAGDEGVALVEIRGDGKPLWREVVRAGAPPHEVNVPIARVRRLEIAIDFGDDLDLADFVDLCEARVTK